MVSGIISEKAELLFKELIGSNKGNLFSKCSIAGIMIIVYLENGNALDLSDGNDTNMQHFNELKENGYIKKIAQDNDCEKYRIEKTLNDIL